MSAAEATLYGAIIAGTFTLLGVVVERLIQRYGRVRCVMEPIEIYTAHGGDAEEMRPLRRLPVPADHLPAPDAGAYNDWNEPLVRCSIKAKMFNEKEARTGLRDVVLVFDGELPLEQPLKDRSTLPRGLQRRYTRTSRAGSGAGYPRAISFCKIEATLGAVWKPNQRWRLCLKSPINLFFTGAKQRSQPSPNGWRIKTSLSEETSYGTWKEG